ncbi:MAG: serine--tRNA ligase [Desulfobacterales bacterium C00003106]|jgi:seryl-tRNA synthetase|nr:serine--tRNA ligase [Deltaproteobacteria bacterium]OEU53817.1 MAG: serine--tRNA ligase [Desulfobacterales bacterium C00003106]
MLDLKRLRRDVELVKKELKKRGGDYDHQLEEFANVDAERRSILSSVEALKHERNVVSDAIARMKKAKENAADQIEKMRAVSQKIKEMDGLLSEKEEAIHNILMSLPNVPHSSVPEGNDSADNPVLKTVGSVPDFDFQPLDHWTIGEQLGILDFKRAARMSGARFALYFGQGAQLERALINFMLDIQTGHGYREVLPPFIVNRTAMTATGQLPKFEEDLFKLEGLDYFLIPTAEVPVTNIHQGEILDEEDLPLYYAAHTACFRSEAGSYGKDTRGLIRQHQFNKVEIVKFTTPETSYDELEKLLKDAETVLERLEIPYQVITLCSGDLGFSAAKTYDIEGWMPGQGAYREISSCSNFEDFQARRAGIRFRKKGRKGTRLVHTLNGSGLAVGRTVVALLENYQQADGTVVIPDALRPYMGGAERIVSIDEVLS